MATSQILLSFTTSAQVRAYRTNKPGANPIKLLILNSRVNATGEFQIKPTISSNHASMRAFCL